MQLQNSKLMFSEIKLYFYYKYRSLSDTAFLSEFYTSELSGCAFASTFVIYADVDKAIKQYYYNTL
jgi:hypothetical protein